MRIKLLPWHYGMRNLLRSPGRLAQTVAGNTLVVLLFLAAAAFVRGMQESLVSVSVQDNIMLLGAGSEESIERSEISAATPGIVAASVEGLATSMGEVYVSPEVHMASTVELESDRTSEAPTRNLLAVLRGVTSRAFLVHPEVRIVAGHAPGPDEILVGRLVAAKLGVEEDDLEIGQRIWLEDHAFTICGRFEAPGSVMEAEIWIDLQELMVAAQRDALSCVIVTLDTAEFADIDVFCKQRLDLEMVAVRESHYYAELMRFYRPVQVMVWVTAALIALGGFFGGLNTLYALFAARVRELAALQAIGFSRAAIAISLLQESLISAAAGSLLAAVSGIFLLDGMAVRLSMGAFALDVDSSALALAMASGLALGILGTVPPAWRCLSPPIFQALRSA